ncbi:MAG: protein-glutamate O-methyltransferase CheR [bacterium]
MASDYSESSAPARLLSGEQFEAIRDAITGYCGIALSQDYHARLARVVSLRMRNLRLDDVAAYVQDLTRPGEEHGELSRFVDETTNTETYFFREEFQLDALSHEILPVLVEQRLSRRRLTLWSAGCSSGEEPVTLAMLLRSSPEFERQLQRWEVRILGTDINRRMIRKAREGVYAESSFKGLEEQRKARVQSLFFRPEGKRFSVRPELRSMMSFLHLNLLDRDGAGLLGEMDVVLCRNVLMYFPTDVRLQVLQSFFRKLAVGGYLLLGHSENLLGLDTPFEAARLKDSLVYRKPPRSRWRDCGEEWGC